MMGELELRGDIVIPGELLGKSRKGDNTFSDAEGLRSAVFGLKSGEKDVSVIPLSGQYVPKEGDMVVGVVTEVMRTGWLIGITPAYTAYLNKERRRDREDDDMLDLRTLFKEGDVVSVKISEVNEIKASYVDGPRKLEGGVILTVNAKKIPRVIGSKKSMLSLLRDKTNCRVVVGQNGIIWIDGPDDLSQLIIGAIKKIEAESHTKGLTDRISEYLVEGIKAMGKDPVELERLARAAQQDREERDERRGGYGRGGDRRGGYGRGGDRRDDNRRRDDRRGGDRGGRRDSYRDEGRRRDEGGHREGGQREDKPEGQYKEAGGYPDKPKYDEADAESYSKEPVSEAKRDWDDEQNDDKDAS